MLRTCKFYIPVKYTEGMTLGCNDIDTEKLLHALGLEHHADRGNYGVANIRKMSVRAMGCKNAFGLALIERQVEDDDEIKTVMTPDNCVFVQRHHKGYEDTVHTYNDVIIPGVEHNSYEIEFDSVDTKVVEKAAQYNRDTLAEGMKQIDGKPDHVWCSKNSQLGKVVEKNRVKFEHQEMALPGEGAEGFLISDEIAVNIITVIRNTSKVHNRRAIHIAIHPIEEVTPSQTIIFEVTFECKPVEISGDEILATLPKGETSGVRVTDVVSVKDFLAAKSSKKEQADEEQDV